MTRAIVTTTINPPTPAVRAFAALPDWTLIVVGDEQSDPEPYHELDCVFLPYSEQERYDPELSALIGPRCIQRRNFGFLWAVRELGSDLVASVDDDNYPLAHWGKDLLLGEPATVTEYQSDAPVFDPFNPTNQPQMWHRGFPLQLLGQRSAFECNSVTLFPDVRADFWNGDPDIDAVCRMSFPLQVKFNHGSPFPFTGNKPSPFNSQNTFLMASVIPNYFMHLDVGRFDDILASYHVQALGAEVIYGAPSVVQERNPHDVYQDFERELWGYKNILNVIQDMKDGPSAIFEHLTPRAAKAFRQYQTHFE